MIYITQLIFLKEGKEDAFLEFESYAIPLMEAHKGKMIYRVRPEKAAYVSANEELPYEIHFISFESEAHLNTFLKDDRRLNLIHLKEESIKSTFLVKGVKM